MATHKRYVFTALVTDKNQPLELLAYAIYKADKNEIAESLIAAGKTQQQIDVELKQFHDSVLNSPSIIQNYHTRTSALGAVLVDEIQNSIKNTAKEDFIERVEQLVKQDITWYHHIGAFIMDAIKGVLSTVFVIVVFGGIYSLTLSKDDREALYSATGKSLMDVATGEVPVADNFRAELARKKKEQQEKDIQNKTDADPEQQP